MSRAVVHDPKDAASRFISLLPHNFADKPIDGSNSTFDFTAAKDSCSMDIPGCQIGPGTQAEVLMLDVRRAIGRQRQRRIVAETQSAEPTLLPPLSSRTRNAFFNR